MDLGTGDGRFVVARAAADSAELVIGVDASAAAMAEASRRASRVGLVNACFVAAALESLPVELSRVADLVTVHFPWGSLLRAAVRADASLTRLVRPGGTLRLLLSASARDATTGLPELDPSCVRRAFEGEGFSVALERPATIDDAIAAHSSWGKRLLRARDPARAAWLFDFVRDLSHTQGSA